MGDIGATRLRIGARLKRLRKLKGLSQEELAARLASSAKHISDIERGEANVGLNMLITAAGVLTVDVSEFFRQRDQPSTYVMLREDVERIEDIVARVKRSRSRRTK